MSNNVNPSIYPFFKHTKNGANEFITFSKDGSVLVALTLAAFNIERAAASHAALPALDEGSIGREYQTRVRNEQFFKGQLRSGEDVQFVRGGGSVNEPAIEEYLAGIGSYTPVT